MWSLQFHGTEYMWYVIVICLSDRDTTNQQQGNNNRVEQAHAFTWIRSHLEEDQRFSLPKHEVFDDYRYSAL